MKRIFVALLAYSLLFEVHAFAHNDLESQQSMAKRVVDGLSELGGSIGRTEIPLVGRLKDLLPLAIVAYCWNEYPKQTMVTMTGLLIYVLYNTDNPVRRAFRKYAMIEENAKGEKKRVKAQQKKLELDDSFFDFEGDIELDEQLLEEINQEISQVYEQETIDEFFNEVELDESANLEDEYTEREHISKAAINFL